MPKIRSLLSLIKETDSDICCITETWLAPDEETKAYFVDLRDKEGLGVIRKSRPGTRRSGGVAIIYKASRIQMEPVSYTHLTLPTTPYV